MSREWLNASPVQGIPTTRLNKLTSLIAGASLALAFQTAVAAETPAQPLAVLISVPDQRLAVVCNGELVSRFPVSTSKFGTGDQFGSYKTPLGALKVCDKIGGNLSPGAVIRHRAATGEVLPVNAPGRDPIVTRVIWLDGLESQNKNARSRGIYIHGTPEERTIGSPVSWGCIRMRSKDVIKVFDEVPVGTVVSIIPDKLPHMHRYEQPKPQPAPVQSDVKPPAPASSAASPSSCPAPAAESKQPTPAKSAAPSPRPADLLPPEPASTPGLPAIAEAPEHNNNNPWRALKGSFLLANLPVWNPNKSYDPPKKGAQSTQ